MKSTYEASHAVPAPRAFGWNDLEPETKMQVMTLGLSARWIDDERANLRQLCLWSLVSKDFNGCVAACRRAPELLALRQGASRRDYVLWGNEPGMREAQQQKWGDVALKENFGRFCLSGVPENMQENQLIDKDRGVLALRNTTLDRNELIALLEQFGDAGPSSLEFIETHIVCTPADKNLGDKEKLRQTFVILAELAQLHGHFSSLKELHLRTGCDQYLSNKFAAQLEQPVDNFFGNLKQLKFFSLHTNGDRLLNRMIVVALPDSLKKLSLDCFYGQSQKEMAYLAVKLATLGSLEELYLWMDFEYVIASIGALISLKSCKLKMLEIHCSQWRGWYDLSPFLKGLAANQSLEMFRFEITEIEFPDEIQLPGMLGKGGPKLLEQWLANHPALFDVHLKMPLSEHEYSSLAEGAKRSASLRRLSIYPKFINEVSAFNEYDLNPAMESLAKANQRIISLQWHGNSAKVERQLAANSRICES